MRTQPRLRHNGDCQIVRCRDKDTSSCCHLDTHQRRPWDTGTGGGLKDAFPTFCCFLLWRCSGSGGGRTGRAQFPHWLLQTLATRGCSGAEVVCRWDIRLMDAAAGTVQMLPRSCTVTHRWRHRCNHRL